MARPWLLLLEWTLRLYGLFWIVGGAFTLRQARQSQFMDVILAQLNPEPEDPLVIQAIYLRLKQQRFARAKTKDEREEARVAPSTQNAFVQVRVKVSTGYIKLNLTG